MSIGDTIRAKVASGDLPLDRPEKLYAGYGHSYRCDACDRTIYPAQIEHEVSFLERSRTYRLHLGCAAILEGERLRRGQ